MKNSAHYDYKQDYFNEENLVERFLNYKLSAPAKSIDCDALEPVVDMYLEIYPFLEYGVKIAVKKGKKYLINKNQHFFTGETMNSAWTIFKKNLQLSPGYWNNCENSGISGSLSSNVNLKKLIDNLEKFSFGGNYDHISTFCHLTHTVGNFLPVPKSFNSGRSLKTEDYWDLTLYNLYKWYETRSEENLNNFLTNNADLSNIKQWLNQFESWSDFVKSNYLELYLEDSNNTNSKPKEFWKGHFERYEKYLENEYKKMMALSPQSLEEITCFLTNVNAIILQRGKRLFKIMKQKQESNKERL